MQWAIKQKGFTIVELLIVVVVIAILAAITIVSYNGIKARADSAALLADMDGVAKSLEIFYADNGRYPSNGTDYANFKSNGPKVRRHPVATNSMLYCIDTDNPRQWILLAYGYPTSSNANNQKWTSDGVKTNGVSIGSGGTTCQTQFGSSSPSISGVWINNLVNYSN